MPLPISSWSIYVVVTLKNFNFVINASDHEVMTKLNIIKSAFIFFKRYQSKEFLTIIESLPWNYGENFGMTKVTLLLYTLNITCKVFTSMFYLIRFFSRKLKQCLRNAEQKKRLIDRILELQKHLNRIESKKKTKSLFQFVFNKDLTWKKMI